MRSEFDRASPSITLVAGVSGIFLPVVIFTCLGFAFAVSPGFNWTRQALSDLGVAPASAVFFNSGVVLGGLLFFIFSLGLLQVSSKKLGACLFALSSIALMGIGVFNESLFVLHFITSASFFVLLGCGLFVIGVTKQDPLSQQMSLAALVLAVLAACSTLFFFVTTGIAIPESLSCFPAFFWCMIVGVKMLGIHTTTALRPGVKPLR